MRRESVVVEVETRVEAPPHVVFGYFTEPELYARWQGLSAELDPRPGGVYRVRMRSGLAVRGEFVEVERPRRLVFTWGWEGDDSLPPGSSTVEVTFEPDGEATIVRLRHRGLPEEASAGLHEKGWRHYLGRLGVAGAGGDAGPDPALDG